MGLPVYRFTLSHPSEGTKIISEPDGWKDAKLKLERHPDFHSLVEYFEGDFIFYGSNGFDDGGINFILAVENRFGPDAEITMTADISLNDGYSFENIFTGVLDLSALQHMKNNKLSCPVIPRSSWVKFIARKETPVDIQSTTDIDGNNRTVIDYVTVNMTSQKVRRSYKGYQEEGVTVTYDIPDNQYGIIDFAQEPIKEINEKYFLPRVESSDRPDALFFVEYGGDYAFDIEIRTATAVLFGSGTESALQVRLQINDNAATVLTQTSESAGLESWINHNYSGTISLNKNDEIRLYFYNNNASGTSYQFVWFANILQESHLFIDAETVYDDTTCEAFLIHDVAQSIIERITSVSFYSEYFGGTLTNGRVYASDGCAWNNILAQGLQIRRYTLSDKDFFISFDKWWKGANPIFNLGLGIENISGTEYIRVENKAHFYDRDSAAVVLFDNVREMTREYDDSFIFKKIEIGFSKWQSEDIAGIDDPQTKRTFATRLQKIGTDLVLYSDFIAASIAIEVTRRKTIEKSADYKYDNDVFIILVDKNDVSPDVYIPRLESDSAFAFLLNADSRYNTQYGATRNLYRWLNYITGGLNKYLNSSIKFVSGEGNYLMGRDYIASDGVCLTATTATIYENENIDLSVHGNTQYTRYLHLAELFTIEIDCSWEDYSTIRGNRKKTIGISQTTSGHKKFFIKQLEYDICRSKAKMQLWPVEEFEIQVVT